MLELDAIEWRPEAGRAELARRRERGELLPVLQEQARLVQLRHVLDDPVELAVQLLARHDRGARFGHADAVPDHQIREGAVRERGHEGRCAAAQRLVARALAKVLAQLLEPLVRETLVQRAQIAGKPEGADLFRVLALREEVEHVVAHALVRRHRPEEAVHGAARRHAREPHRDESDDGDEQQHRLQHVQRGGHADDQSDAADQADGGPGHAHHPPHRVHRAPEQVLELRRFEPLQVDRDDAVEQDRVRMPFDDRRQERLLLVLHQVGAAAQQRKPDRRDQ